MSEKKSGPAADNMVGEPPQDRMKRAREHYLAPPESDTVQVPPVRVPGGWIYEAYETVEGQIVAMCFVPFTEESK